MSLKFLKINDWFLFAIVVATILISRPYFSHNYYPVHDTLSSFQFFSFYYSQLFFSHELPWWMPYSAYGMPIDPFLMFNLGPFQYLALTLGYLFKIKNTLFLFSASLVADTLFLALGTYYFARHILQNRWIALICVISLLILVQYDRQIYWNFKILLPLPFCLYWAQLGLERFNLGYLLLSVATLLTWSFGSIPYVLPVQCYVICFYCLFLILSGFIKIKRPAHLQASTVLLSIGALCVIFVDIYMLYHIRSIMMHEMAYNAVGRDANFQVGFDYYLTYGGNTGFEKIIELLNGLPTSHTHDFLAYVGVVNLIFVVYGVFFTLTKRRELHQSFTSSHIALALTTLLILAFTVTSTGIAKLGYFMPGMKMVRHIGYFITIPKLLLVILAGFGVYAYWFKKPHSSTKYPRLDTMYLIPLAMGILCLITISSLTPTPYTTHAHHAAWAVIIVTILCQIFLIRNRVFLLLLLMVSAYYMVSYRTTIYRMADLFLIPFPSEYTHVRPNKFQPIRVLPTASNFFPIKPIMVYANAGDYLQEDFCPSQRQDIVSLGIKKLFVSRKPFLEPTNNPREFLYPFDDEDLKRSLGCGTPKLRLVSVNSESTLSASKIYQLPSLTGSISVKQFRPNSIDLTVTNQSNKPAWLIYADANNPNWSATVDKKPTKILTANIAFKAVQIPPGKHAVHFTFTRPPFGFITFWIMMISLASLFIAFVVIFPFCRKHLTVGHK